MELLDAITAGSLVDDVRESVHARRELREEDHRFHVGGETALKISKAIEVRLHLVECGLRMSVGRNVSFKSGSELLVDGS